MKHLLVAPLALGLAGPMVGCSEPPAAIIPNGVEPSPPASNDCQPPYPMSFAQAHFFFADLDADRTCTQFIEQDRCILGIFRDCIADDGEGTRQWAGRVETLGAERSVRLDGMTNGATVLSRSPACCEGALMPASEGPVEWSLLQCRLNRCGNPRDVAHVGLYFERYTEDLDPQARLLTPLSVDDADEGPLWVPSRGELWFSGSGRLEMIPVDPRSNRRTLDIPGDDSGPMLISSDAVFASADNALTRIELATLALQTTTFEGAILAMTLTPRGLLVAYENTPDTMSTLVLVSLDGTILDTESVPGRVRDLAALQDHPDLAVVSRHEEPNLLAVSNDLTLRTFLDFKEDGGDQVTLLDMVEGYAMPGQLAALPGGWIGFVDRCSDRALSRCWFEVSEDTAVLPVRIGIPGAVRFGPFWYDRLRDRVVLTTRSGRLIVLGRHPFHPFLQETVDIGGEPEGLAGASSGPSCTDTSTAYVYIRDLREVKPVQVSGFCPD